MGIINRAKGSSAGEAAAAAVAAGQSVFVFKAIEATIKSQTTGSMPGMAEQIQAIEAQGWALANMAAADSSKADRIALVLIFRRR